MSPSSWEQVIIMMVKTTMKLIISFTYIKHSRNVYEFVIGLYEFVIFPFLETQLDGK